LHILFLLLVILFACKVKSTSSSGNGFTVGWQLVQQLVGSGVIPSLPTADGAKKNQLWQNPTNS